jgi:uncharacterized protein involved in exopolysaccharide biosynthesis
MQPSDEELLFNRSFMGVSQFNPATIIAQSHVEHLLSRPVAERTLDLLLDEYGDQAVAEPMTAFGRLKAAFWRNWSTLNYGYYVPPSTRDQLVNEIQQSLDVEIVEGSYILSITVSNESPKLAAAVANTIAKAYTDAARADFLAEAREVVSTVGRQEEAARKLLADRKAERDAKAQLVGVTDVAAERAVALNARETARENLRDARAALAGRTAQLDRLRKSLLGQTDPGLIARIKEDTVLGEAELQSEASTVALREKALAEIEGSLAKLQRAEQDLSGLDLAVQEASVDVDELQRRRIALDLATQAEFSQIRVIDPAVAPTYPTFPKVLLNTVIACFVGAALSLVPIFAVDVLGSRVRTRYDLEQLVGRRALPTLTRRAIAKRPSGGRLRHFATAFGRRVLATEDPGGPIFVTGDLPAPSIAGLAAYVAAAGAIAEGIPRGSPSRDVVPLPPLVRFDWSATGNRVVVIGISAGELERSEVEGILAQAAEKDARPYFVLVA